MSDVPDEILREILSWLPMAPLLRFRCVSKSWKCLIEDRQFIKHHLNHSRKTNSNLNIILNSYRDRRLYSADFDLLDETNMATFKQLSHPLIERGPKILGECDGLLVLRNDKDDVTVLWNPSVRRFNEIPSCGIEFPEHLKNIVYGFGYDVVSDDYKLIRIVQRYGKNEDEFNSEVKVYSLKSDSWRRIPDFPYCLRERKTHGEFVNGALHWMIVTRKVKLGTGSLIAAYDLGIEEYSLLPLPKFASGNDYMKVAVVGGCLSLIYRDNEHRVGVWVMKEYEVQESWSILFKFDICDFAPMTFMMPLAYSRCGRKVLVGLDDRFLMWYNLDTKSTYFPMVPPLEDSGEMHICLQSLVLINSGTSQFDLFTKKKQEGKGKKRSSTPRNDYLAKASRPNGHD